MQGLHRLTHTELCQLKWMLGNLLALVSLWTLIYLDVQAEGLLVFTAITILFSIGWPGIPARIPQYVWSIVIPLILSLIIITDFFVSQPDIIPPLVRMLLMLVLVRSVHIRFRREDLQLIVLCLFMVMLAGVLTLSITFGIQIMIFTLIAMCILFLITLTEPSNRGGQASTIEYHWDTFQWPVFLDRIWKAQDFRLLGIIFLLFVGVVGVSSLIFVTIPRFQIDQAIPLFNLKSSKSLSGFSDRIEYGEVVDIIEDNSMALRVDVENPQEKPLNPYWRMVVLDDYDNGVFQMSLSARAYRKDMNVFDFQIPYQTSGEMNPTQRWTFYLEGGISQYLPLVGTPNSIRFQDRQRINFNQPLNLVTTRYINSSVLFYQTESDVLKGRVPASEIDLQLQGKKSIEVTVPRGVSEKSTINYPYTTLAVPGNAETLRILDDVITEITQGKNLSMGAFTSAAVDYLHQNHGYSLNVAIPDGNQELMVRWLASDLPGHCELFAGAFTLLARRAGYPTRIVTGFKGGAWNAYEQYYMVRNRNAHAWCEVYDGNASWIRIDPTPGNGPINLQAATTTPGVVLNVDTTMGAYFDSLRILWYRRVVKFDRSQQRELAGGVKGASTQLFESVNKKIYAGYILLKSWISIIWSGGIWLMLLRLAIAGLAIAAVIRWLPQVLNRLSALRIITGRKGDPIRRKAGRWITRLQTTPSSHADGIASNDWHHVYKGLQMLRYGHRRNWPNPHEIFRHARSLMKRRG